MISDLASDVQTPRDSGTALAMNAMSSRWEGMRFLYARFQSQGDTHHDVGSQLMPLWPIFIARDMAASSILKTCSHNGAQPSNLLVPAKVSKGSYF